MAENKIDRFSLLPAEAILAIAEHLEKKETDQSINGLQPILNQLAFFSTSKDLHHFFSKNDYNLKRMQKSLETSINLLAVKAQQNEHTFNEYQHRLAATLERMKGQHATLAITWLFSFLITWLSFFPLLLAHDYVGADLLEQIIISEFLTMALLLIIFLTDSITHEVSQRTLGFFEKRSTHHEKEKIAKLSQSLSAKKMVLETKLNPPQAITEEELSDMPEAKNPKL